MDGTRARVAANEASSSSSEPIEDGEVPEIEQRDQPMNPGNPAVDSLISSAAQLGFSTGDIQAFLQRRLPAADAAGSPAMDVDVSNLQAQSQFQGVRDPSLSKPIENSTFDLKGLVKDKFTSSTKGNKERFEKLDSVLIHNGLYTMAKKTRLIPVLTALNPYGQSKDIITVTDNVAHIVKADNIVLWCDDMNRLNQVLQAAFDKSLHHHSKGFLHPFNGVLAYTDLRNYYHGQNNHGARDTRHALEGFRIKPLTNSVRQDIVKFEELRKAAEYAVMAVFTDLQNNCYLSEKFDEDSRPGVVASITASNQMDLPYVDRLDALHKLHNCDIVPSASKDISLKAFTPAPSKTKQLCRNFAKGSCKYGSKCFNIHDKTAAPERALKTPSAEQQLAVPNNNGVKAAGPTYIDARHRQIIGDGRSSSTPTNVFGLSRKQRIVVAALQAHDMNSTDSWINQSHYNHVSRDSNGNVFAKVFTTSSSSSSSSTYNYESDIARTLLPVTEQDFNILDLTPSKKPIPVILSTDSDEDTYLEDADATLMYDVLLYNDLIIRNDVTSFTHQNKVYITFVISNFHITEVHGSYKEDALKSYLQYTRFYPNPLAGAQRVDIALFNWSPSYPLYVYEVNSVFRTGTPAFMELITSLGNTFLKADRFAASRHIPLSSESYMTFSPLSTTYHAPGSPGSYISTQPSVQAYSYYFNLLDKIDITGDVKMYLLLTIIYDFMAFSAQLYRRILKDRAPSLKHMSAIRSTLQRAITAVLDRTCTPEYISLLHIFNAIADTIMPNPIIRDASYMSPPISRLRPREPPSPAVDKLDIHDPVLKKPRTTHHTSRNFPLLYAEVPVPLLPPPVDLRSPEPVREVIELNTPSVLPSSGENHSPSSSSDSSDDDDNSSVHTSPSQINYFATVPLNSIKTTTSKFIMDSGAGKCGTSDISLLKDVRPCHDITVTGAFGPSTAPTQAGKFGPLNLDAVHIEGMGSQTLVSLSQFCAGGSTGTKYIGVFTPTEYRMYDMLTALPILSDLARHGKEAERGNVQNGIYVRESS